MIEKFRDAFTQKKEKKEQTMYSPEEMMKTLTEYGWDRWGMYAFSHEPLEGKFSTEQKAAYTEAAVRCGVEEAKLLKEQFPSASLNDAAESMGLTVKRPSIPTGGGHVVFAQYVEPAEITIFTDCVEKAEALIREHHLGKYFQNTSLEDVLLAHELFHALEYQKKDRIYTQTEKIELWRKPFSNRSRIIALSEIAAMAFAEEMSGLSFATYALDVLLMYPYSREAACGLYEEITEECK